MLRSSITMRRATAWLVFALVATALDACAAECVQPTPADFPLSQCQAVVDHAVYVPEGLSLADLDAAAAAGTGAALLGLVSPECVEGVLLFVCTSAFPPCVEADGAAYPRPVCEHTCNQFVAACSLEPAFLGAPGSIPQCDAVDPQSGAPFFPADGVVVGNDAPGAPEITCAADEAALSGVPYQAIPPGSCEEMRETEFSQCSSLIEGPVFVPSGSSQKELDFNAYNNSFALLWRVIEPEECSAASFRLFCSLSFLGCAEFPLGPGLNLTVPRTPCRSVCQEFNYWCEELLTADGDQRLPCDLILPPDTTSIPLSPDFSFETTCVDPSHEVELYRDCPPLLALSPDDECDLKCPSPIFSDEEWIAYLVIVSVLGWIALIACVLLMCGFATHPLKRQYPRSNPGWHSASLTPFVIVYLLPSVTGGLKTAWCWGDVAGQRGDHYWVVFSSFLVYASAWISVFWYNYVGMSLMLVLTGLDRLPSWLMQIFMHTVAIGVFLIWWVVMISTDSFVNTGTGVPGPDGEKWNEWFQDAVYFIPWTCLVGTAVILLGAVFFYTVFVMGWNGFKTHWRIMAYLLVGLTSTIYSSTYHWEVRIEEDSIRRNFAAWITCAASNIDWERCEPGRLLVFTPFMINTIISLLIPPAFALILLSDGMFTDYWKYLFKRYILRQNVDDPFESVKRAEKVSRNISRMADAGASSTGMSQSAAYSGAY